MFRGMGLVFVMLWLLFLAVALNTIIHAPPIQSDLTQFLPAGKSEQQQLLLDEIGGGSGSRLLIVAISNGSEQQRIAASLALVNSLQASGLFERVLNGHQQLGREERDALFHYRYLLAVPEDYSVEGLQTALKHRLIELSSPLSLVDKASLPADPLATMRSVLKSWQSTGGPLRRGGVWFTKDLSQALLLLQTRAQAFELDEQQGTINTIYQTFRKLPDASNLNMVLSGGPLFGVESRRTISSETRDLTILASLGVTLLLWWLFRSIPVLLVAAVPLFSGVIVGAAVAIGLFGSIHGITLAFGITLIGIAIDYPIHFFSHLQHAQRNQDSNSHLWSTLLLGVLTTVLGFSSLVFSGFTGLSQLGVFSVAGLTAAAVVTRFILPLVVTQLRPALNPTKSMPSFFFRVTSVRGISIVPALFLLVGIAYLVTVYDRVWETRLSRLSPISKEAKTEYDMLRAELGVEDSGRLLLIRGDSQQQILERSEMLDTLLSKAVTDGALQHYELPSRYLPSQREQARRQALLPDGDVLNSNMQQAVKDFPFKPGLFVPFLNDVEQSRQLLPLTVEQLSSTALGVRLDSLLRKHGDTWFGFTRLTGVTDADSIKMLASNHAEWLNYMNLHEESSQIVADYLQETLYYFVMAVLLIVLLLIGVMRSLLLVWRVIIPVVAAVAVSASLQVFFGEHLSLFHVAALLLVMGIGLDYAIFVVRTPISSPVFSTTMRSLLICNVSTLLVFGLLALSDVPVLHSIGLTVTLGGLGALIFSFMMVHDNANCTEGSA
jgi:predicted exporter